MGFCGWLTRVINWIAHRLAKQGPLPPPIVSTKEDRVNTVLRSTMETKDLVDDVVRNRNRRIMAILETERNSVADQSWRSGG